MKKTKLNCDLKSCFFCRKANIDWLPLIDIKRVTLKIKKGDLLFKEEEPVKGIFFVNEGVVKVHRKWGDDRELIFRFATAGEIVGHRGVASEEKYPVSATALTDVVACFIDIEFFFSTLRVNNEMLFELMMFFATELHQSERKMNDLVNLSVKERVVKSLYFLEKKFGTTDEGFINMKISRQDIASFAGTTYETYFRVMNELSEEGLLQIDGKQVKLNPLPAA